MYVHRVMILLVILLLLSAAPVLAQWGGRVSVGADVGIQKPYMSHPVPQYFRTKTDLVFGGHIDYGISDHAGIQFGLLRSDQEVEVRDEKTNTMTMQDLYVHFRWNLMLGYLEPYALFGVSYYLINLDPPLEDENDPGVTAGLGVTAILSDNIALGLCSRFSYIFVQDLDSARVVQGLATVTFSF